MNLEEYIVRWNNFREDVARELPKFLATQAGDLFALIRLRIVDTGLDAGNVPMVYSGDGEIDGAYSKAYARKRQRAGRQIDHVDLEFTRGGAGMWGSTGIVEQKADDNEVTISIGGRDEFSQNKIDWNSERYGDIMRPTNKEEETVLTATDEWLLSLAIKNGVA